jgi:hypothetical protein
MLLRSLWPEEFMVAVSVVYSAGIMTTRVDSANLHTRTRLLSFVGLGATAALLFLGLLSPYYGIVAFFAIPAPIIFGILMIRPALAWKNPKLRAYLNICVLASGLTWAFQIFWELRR